MFSLFKKNKQIKIFAEELATELFSLMPADAAKEYHENIGTDAASKYQKTVDNAILRLAQFKKLNKLGVYGKAKLHQVFLYKLIALGYDKETATKINRLFLLKTP